VTLMSVLRLLVASYLNSQRLFNDVVSFPFQGLACIATHGVLWAAYVRESVLLHYFSTVKQHGMNGSVGIWLFCISEFN